MAGALGEQQGPTTKSTTECQTHEEHIAVWLGARWRIRSDMVRKYMLAVSRIITLKAVMKCNLRDKAKPAAQQYTCKACEDLKKFCLSE